MMKKIMIALLTVCLALFAGFTVVSAAEMPKPERTNVLKGLSEDAVRVTDANGNEASLTGGPHGGNGQKSTFIDGVISSTATATIAVDGKGVIGYVTVDAGKEYVVDRVLVDLCHDWGGQNLVVELSLTEDFANPVTVYDNRAGSEYTADESVAVSSVLYNKANAGITFNFSPVKARYIRVTDNTVGNGKAQGYTTIGEIQMFAVSGVSYVYSDTTGRVKDGIAKLYATEEGSEIYYTTDGGAPTKNSLKYANGIEVNGTAKVRAIAYKDGKYGCPADFVFTGSKQFVAKNAALGKSAKVYHPDGSDAVVSNHNGGQTLACVTDGIMNAENSVITDSVAFVQVDLGESVWINKAILNLWHDHVWRSVTVQLSDDVTFATGVQTIFCSDYGNWQGLASYVGSLDETWADKTNVEWIGGHTAAKGFEFNFAPIKGRYIRALAQDGGGAPYSSIYTELQAWTCEAPATPFVRKNAALGKEVKAYHTDGSAAVVSNHNGGQTLACVTDGIMGAENSVVTDSVAFIQVDMGESVWINKAVLNLWHDHVWRSVTVQLSDDVTFATGVQTIFCSDYGNWQGLASYVGSLDETWADKTNVEWIGGHTAAKGFEFNFKPIKGRYIRALAQDGSSPWSSVYTELQAWTCEDPAAGDNYEYQNYLSSVENVGDIEVYEGKEFGELGLPQTIKLGYSDGTEKTVYTAWTIAGYDKTKAGEYFATLTITDDKDVYGIIASVSVKITVKALNVAALTELYDGVKDLSADNYTLSTRKKFIAARESAKELLERSYKTQEEVDSVLVALEKCFDGLVNKGDTAALKRLIDGLNVEEESKYTISTYAVFAEKKLAAEGVLADGGNDDMSQADVDKTADELEKAVVGLAKRANPSSLKAVYDAAKAEKGYGEQSTNGYNRATYSAYMDAMYNAEKFFDEEYLKDVPQVRADEAETRLNEAIAGLIAIADRKPLDDIAEKIKNAKAENYTATSFAALVKVYEEAKPVIEKADDLLTEEEIAETAAALNKAFNELVASGDKKQLNATIGNCAGEEEGVYTSTSYAVYRKALYEAEKIKASDDVSQSEVDSAAKALENAYNGLEKLGDKKVLNEVIAKAEALGELTGDRKDNVEKALAYAKSIVGFDGEVTEKQVNEAKELLEKAMAEGETSSGCTGSLGTTTAALVLLTAVAVVAIIRKKRVKDENV